MTPPHASTALAAVELTRDYLNAMRTLDGDGGQAVEEAAHRLDARLRNLTDDPGARDLIGILASLAAGLARAAGRGMGGAETVLDAMALHTLSVEAGGD